MTERSIDRSITVQASPDAVWRALTEASELECWFPLHASVTPGVGGGILLSWGPGAEGESPIEVWEPQRHLRTAQEFSGGENAPPLRIAVDFYIEAAGGGTTVVRLVHSGFQAGADWDAQYDALDGGWTYFLYNLRHYLERHAGTRRIMVWERRPLTRPRHEVWSEVLAALGEPPVLPLSGGVRGTTVLSRAPNHLAVLLPELNDALLFVELELGEERFNLGVWLSTYGLEPATAAELQQSLGPWLDGVVGPAATEAAAG